jgi:putative transcription factor
MEHQDWNTTVLRKTSTQIAKNNKKNKLSTADTMLKHNATKNTQRQNNFGSKIDDNEYLPQEKISHGLKLNIQKGRMAKKLSQKQLATQCNLPTSTIKDYESGNVVPNGQILNKLSRVLGVTLKNTKK